MIKIIYMGTIEENYLEESNTDEDTRATICSQIIDSIKDKIFKSQFLIGDFIYEPSEHLANGRVYFAVNIELLPDPTPPDSIPGSSSG